MAKSKKSRRARRQDTQKQVSRPVVTSPPPAPAIEAVPPAPAAPAPEKVEPAPVTNRKAVNFAQEYFYVYQDMRNVLFITVLMFAVLVGLSFAI